MIYRHVSREQTSRWKVAPSSIMIPRVGFTRWTTSPAVRKRRRSLKDVEVLRRTDASSHHHRLLCKLQMKLKKTSEKNSEQLFDSAVKFQFALESNAKVQIWQMHDVNALCESTQTFLATSKGIPDYRRRQEKEWISETTWQFSKDRRTAGNDI